MGDFFNSNIACLSDFLNACKLRQQKVGVTSAVAIHHLMDCRGGVDAVVTLAWFGSAYTIAVIGATSLLPRPITAFVSALKPSSCFYFVIWTLSVAPFCCVDAIAQSAFYCNLVVDIVFVVRDPIVVDEPYVRIRLGGCVQVPGISGLIRY